MMVMDALSQEVTFLAFFLSSHHRPQAANKHANEALPKKFTLFRQFFCIFTKIHGMFYSHLCIVIINGLVFINDDIINWY